MGNVHSRPSHCEFISIPLQGTQSRAMDLILLSVVFDVKHLWIGSNRKMNPLRTEP